VIQLRGPMTLPAPVRLEAPSMSEYSWLEIDLSRLERNMRSLRFLLSEHAALASQRPNAPKICACVKKNAYGLGAAPIAHRLIKAGADMLAVYGPQEAEQLTERGIISPMLVLMPIDSVSRTDTLYRPAVAERLHLTIHDLAQLKSINTTGQTLGIRMPIHLYLDTGMSRGGLNLRDFHHVIQNQKDYPHTRLAGVYTHLATAGTDADFVQEQASKFADAIAEVESLLPADCMKHLANSMGILRDGSLHMDMVRPGLSLLGYGPELMQGPMMAGQNEADPVELEPVMRWVTRIIHVGEYPRRSPVGYGSTHKLKRASVLGMAPVGYADGYPVSLSNKAVVRVRPRQDQGDGLSRQTVAECRVLGQVNMDQIVFDLTDIAGDDPQQLKGSYVELISHDPKAPNSLSALAELAKTHPYELLCRLSPAVKRVYLSD